MPTRRRAAAALVACLLIGQAPATPPTAIPAPVVARLAESLAAAKRDTRAKVTQLRAREQSGTRADTP